MRRRNLRVTIRIKGRRVVRAHVRARERCARTGASGFLNFDLRRNDGVKLHGSRFRYRLTYDDARGNATVILEGLVHRRKIQGVFLFRNHEGASCGTGRPGKRRVHYTARLKR